MFRNACCGNLVLVLEFPSHSNGSLVGRPVIVLPATNFTEPERFVECQGTRPGLPDFEEDILNEAGTHPPHRLQRERCAKPLPSVLWRDVDGQDFCFVRSFSANLE